MTGTCIHCGSTQTRGLLGGLCPRCVAARLKDEAVSREAGRLPADYEWISELGRGGMGVVYLARQRQLDRLVAVKVLLAGPHANTEARQRFEAEARAAAQLQHANIVRILGFGHHENNPFYTMELIEGDNLGERVRKQPLRPQEAASIVSKAARAVHHAHLNGLIHRDVKPSNILLDAESEPHLTDFGIAIPIDTQGWLTQTGLTLGSPSFMAPEQLSGDATRLSDVYALGAVLYFSLTGRPPFVASRLPDLLQAIQTAAPASPNSLDVSLPTDLATITLKALSKAPTDRYASALHFAEDIERWLAGRPIHARPPTWLKRASSWARRNRPLAFSLIAALTLGPTFTLLVLWQWRQTSLLAATRQRELYAATLKLASDSLTRNDLGAAEDNLALCPPQLRDAAWGLLRERARGNQQGTLAACDHTVVELAVAPDGSSLATACQQEAVKLWSPEGTCLRSLPDTDYTWSLAYSPDGKSLLTADKQTRLWEVDTGHLLGTFAGQSAAFSPDGKRLATCAGHRFLYEGEPGPVFIWDRLTGEKLLTLTSPARLLAWSHDGKRLAVSDAENTLLLFDANTGKPLQQWSHSGPAWDITFSPDDRHLLASGWGRQVRLWSVEAPNEEPRLLTHPLGTWSLRFSPDGTLLAVACSDRRIYLWNTSSWTLEGTLSGHKDEVWALAWAGEHLLLGAGRDPRLLLWNWSPAHTSNKAVLENPGYAPVWLPKDKLAILEGSPASGLHTRIVSLPHLKTEQRLDGAAPAYWNQETHTLFGWNVDNALERVAVGETEIAHAARPVLHFERTEAMADLPLLLPEKRLACGPSNQGSFLFWDLGSGRLKEEWPRCFEAPLRAWSLSRNGRHLAWSGHSGQLTLADLHTGHRCELKGHLYEVDCVAFSPDSRWLVSAGVEGRLLLWDAATGERIALLGRHVTSAGHVVFSPDGNIVAALEPGIGIHLWHLPTRREVDLIPLEDQQSDEWMEFSPDGRWLGARTHDGQLHLYPIASPQTQNTDTPAHLPASSAHRISEALLE